MLKTTTTRLLTNYTLSLKREFRLVKTMSILVMSLWVSSLYAQANNTFQHSYGGTQDDFGGSVLVLPDHGYILTGFTKSFGSGSHDIMVIRTDSLGKKIWSKVYGGTGDEGNASYYVYPSMDITLSSDSNIVICSNTESYGKGGKDIYLLKLDLKGNVIWTSTYGGSGSDIGYGIANTSDGGYLIAGQTFSYGAGNGDVLLVKTNASGGVSWAKAYGNSTHEEAAYKIIPSIDGNFLIAGYSYISSTAHDQMLMKVDKNGKLLWSKVYGTNSDDPPNDILETPDKSIYVDGFSYNTGTGAGMMVLAKYDSVGNLGWTRVYNKGSLRTMAYDTKNKLITIFGVGPFSGYAQRNIIAQFDTAGTFKKMNSYGPGSTTKGYTLGEGHLMAALPDGGFLSLGAESSFGTGNFDLFLVKTDADLNTHACNGISTTLPGSKWSFSDHSYSFSSATVDPGISSGVTSSDVVIGDSVLCPPFAANFNFGIIASLNVQLTDLSYFNPTLWTWDFGDPSSSSNTSSAKNPTHNFSAGGTYAVKLIASNGSISDTVIKTIRLHSSGIAGSGENPLTVQLYPNPAKNLVHIKTGGALIQNIIATDILGQTIFSLKPNEGTETLINTKSFAPGIYIIDILTNKGETRERLIKN